MKPSFALLLPLALLIMTGCDRGTAPTCDSGDSTCVLQGGVSSGSNGGSNNNPGGGHPKDTSQVNLIGTEWKPAYDTGNAVKLIPASALAGVPNILGGTARQLAFYVKDTTLHIIASSDGSSQSNSGRETVYDINIFSTDTFDFGWDSKTDAGLVAGIATGYDQTTVLSSHPLRLAVIKMPVTAWALNAHLIARRGATLVVWAKVRSGNPLHTAEDSLPRLDIGTTRGLLFSGGSLTPIPSDPFSIKIP